MEIPTDEKIILILNLNPRVDLSHFLFFGGPGRSMGCTAPSLAVASRSLATSLSSDPIDRTERRGSGWAGGGGG